MADISDEAILYCLNEREQVEICSGFSVGQIATGLDKEPEWKSFLRDHFILSQNIYYWSKYRLIRMPPSINANSSRWTFDKDLFDKIGRPGLLRSQHYLEKLHRMLSERGITMTLAVYPHPAQIYANDRNSIQRTFWADWAKSNSVRFVEHFTSLFRLRDMLGTEKVINDYYIPGDVHFNQRGNQLIADDLMQQYFNENYLKGHALKRNLARLSQMSWRS